MKKTGVKREGQPYSERKFRMFYILRFLALAVVWSQTGHVHSSQLIFFLNYMFNMLRSTYTGLNRNCLTVKRSDLPPRREARSTSNIYIKKYTKNCLFIDYRDNSSLVFFFQFVDPTC